MPSQPAQSNPSNSATSPQAIKPSRPRVSATSCIRLTGITTPKCCKPTSMSRTSSPLGRLLRQLFLSRRTSLAQSWYLLAARTRSCAEMGTSPPWYQTVALGLGLVQIRHGFSFQRHPDSTLMCRNTRLMRSTPNTLRRRLLEQRISGCRPLGSRGDFN